MKIIEHGRYYYDFINVRCEKCNCIYEMKKEDIKEYGKPKKVRVGHIDCSWIEKYKYYSLCPECGYDNYLSDMNYDTLTNDVLVGDTNVKD